MKRLAVALLALALLVVPLGAEAQPPAKIPRIGFLSPSSDLPAAKSRSNLSAWCCLRERQAWSRSVRRCASSDPASVRWRELRPLMVNAT